VVAKEESIGGCKSCGHNPQQTDKIKDRLTALKPAGCELEDDEDLRVREVAGPAMPTYLPSLNNEDKRPDHQIREAEPTKENPDAKYWRYAAFMAWGLAESERKKTKEREADMK
jgi:hypothetical protein